MGKPTALYMLQGLHSDIPDKDHILGIGIEFVPDKQFQILFGEV